jgi:hypothetical protein
MFLGKLVFESEGEGAIKTAMNEAGWLAGGVLAAGQLRQGRLPSKAAMLSGAALLEIWRPRRSKALPRHFVLAVTDTEVVAFKAAGGSNEGNGPYVLRIDDKQQGAWPRSEVRMTELPEGPEGGGGVLRVGAEDIPVFRPFLPGEESTTELLRVLSAG